LASAIVAIPSLVAGATLTLAPSSRPITLIALGLTVVGVGPLVFEMGVLQGLARYRSLAVVTFLQGASRFVTGSLLVVLGTGYLGAFIGACSAIILSAAAGAIALRKQFVLRGRRVVDLPRLNIEFHLFARTAALLLAQAIFLNLDSLLAPTLLTARESGAYVGGLAVTKILRFAPMFAIYFLLPRATAEHARGINSLRALFLSVAFVLVVDLPPGAALIVDPGIVVRLLVGAQYQLAGSATATLAVAVLVQSVVLLWTVWFVGRGTTGFAWVLILAVGVELAAAVSARSAADLAVAVLVASVFALVMAASITTVERVRGARRGSPQSHPLDRMRP
jgi:hypothetical protein